jgi:hypothetical protein
MADVAFFVHYGEASRIVGFFPEPTDRVARRIFDLHRRHVSAVCRVFDEAITSHAAALRQGTLPSTCLLSLIVSRRDGESAYPERSGELERSVTIGADIRMAVDEVQKRVIFHRWGEIRGVSAELIITLAEPFRQAMRDELAPEHYPFTETSNLIRKTNCDANEGLRRRVLRCRNKVAQLATNAGDPPPSLDAVIENSQWHGYRLNPDRIRIVALSELSQSE